MRNFSKILIILTFGFFANVALARELPPLPGEPKPFELATPTTIQLENGLEVIFVDFGIVPKVTISIVVEVGNKNEGSDTWLSDLTAELMKEGTTSRSAFDIVVEAADMGGGVNIGVGLDQTSVSMDVLSEYGGEAIGLMADILINPAFPEAEIPRIKQNFLRNLSVARTQSRSIASEAFLALLYGEDHPYGNIFPDDGQLEGYTIDQIKAFYVANFGAARTRIYVVGQFDQAAIENAIRDAFGDWDAGAVPLDLPPSPQSLLRVKLIDRPGSEQSTIYLGLPVLNIDDPDTVAFQVMHTLLGGSSSSRIVQNIREEKGYTYSPRASITRRKGTAYWTMVADVTTSVTGPALHEIFYEIRNLQENVPPGAEVDTIQNYLAGIFVLQNGSRGGIIRQLAALNLQGLDTSYLNSFVSRVLAVEDWEISALAGSQLPLDQMTLVLVGDLSLIEEQIRALPELADAEFVE
ncbi:MAG: M16 family metallopeptidase [Alphaproteobacteria bacterium]